MDNLSQKKDANFSIFRGLGKILHRKHLDNDNDLENRIKIESKLPKKFSKYQRKPMSVEPEEILSKLPISQDLTIQYLHQNYLDFFNLKSESADFDIKFDCLNNINDNFIISDQIMSKLNSIESGNSMKYKEISSLISIRSILFNMSFDEDQKSSKSQWMPLHKPFYFKMLELRRLKRANIQKMSEKMDNETWSGYSIGTPNEFVTNVLPFLSMRKEYKEFAMKTSGFNSTMRQFKIENSKSITSNDNDPNFFIEQNIENIEPKAKTDNSSQRSGNTKKNYDYEDDFSVDIID